jgi:hypothetical protein
MSTCHERMAEPVAAFRTAADAWFWTLGALRARHEGCGRSGGTVRRPCDPDDVVCCLDRLYRKRRINHHHARVLRDWGNAKCRRTRAPARTLCSGVRP